MSAAVQSTANPAPMPAGHIDIDDGAEFDPFDEMQEAAEVEIVRMEARNRGLVRRVDWY